MFENLKNMASLLSNARQLKERFDQLQAELGRKTVEADAGAGAVRVVANGRMEIVSVHLDRPLLVALAGQGSDADQQVVEDLIAAATNAALQKARELIQQEVMRVTGGLNLPGLPGLGFTPPSTP